MGYVSGSGYPSTNANYQYGGKPYGGNGSNNGFSNGYDGSRGGGCGGCGKWSSHYYGAGGAGLL